MTEQTNRPQQAAYGIDGRVFIVRASRPLTDEEHDAVELIAHLPGLIADDEEKHALRAQVKDLQRAYGDLYLKSDPHPYKDVQPIHPKEWREMPEALIPHRKLTYNVDEFGNPELAWVKADGSRGSIPLPATGTTASEPPEPVDPAYTFLSRRP